MLSEKERLKVFRPEQLPDVFATKEPVDELHGYTNRMWEILTDCVLQEWFNIRLYSSGFWFTMNQVDRNSWLLACINRRNANRNRNEIESKYLSQQLCSNRMSIFEGYGYEIDNALQLEFDGLSFWARQHQYLKDDDQKLILVSSPSIPPYFDDLDHPTIS